MRENNWMPAQWWQRFPLISPSRWNQLLPQGAVQESGMTSSQACEAHPPPHFISQVSLVSTQWLESTMVLLSTARGLHCIQSTSEALPPALVNTLKRRKISIGNAAQPRLSNLSRHGPLQICWERTIWHNRLLYPCKVSAGNKTQ